jgi:hypothetical protein
VRRARANRAGKAATEQQLGIFRGDQSEHRHWMLQIDLGESRNVIVRNVIVTLDHSRHQRTAGEIVHNVVAQRLGGVAVHGHRDDAFAFDDDGRIFPRRVTAVDQICAAKERACHFELPP